MYMAIHVCTKWPNFSLLVILHDQRNMAGLDFHSRIGERGQIMLSVRSHARRRQRNLLLTAPEAPRAHDRNVVHVINRA